MSRKRKETKPYISDSDSEDEKIRDMIMEDILDSTASKISYENEDYYLLIKKQQHSSFCMLYFTDFSDNFWLQKITYPYLELIREKMKIKTNMKNFVQYFVKGFKQETTVHSMDPAPVLKVRIRVSQGLLMNYRLQFDVHVSASEKPQYFKKLLKLFGRQIFEAQEKQCERLRNIIENKREENEKKISEKKEKYMEEAELRMQTLFGHTENKIIPEKNRDLINPLRKKRKGKGIKIGDHMNMSSESSDS